jgi:hypothetical protein
MRKAITFSRSRNSLCRCAVAFCLALALAEAEVLVFTQQARQNLRHLFSMRSMDGTYVQRRRQAGHGNHFSALLIMARSIGNFVGNFLVDAQPIEA